MGEPTRSPTWLYEMGINIPPPLDRWGNRGRDRISNVPKVTRPLSGRPRISIQGAELQNLFLYPSDPWNSWIGWGLKMHPWNHLLLGCRKPQGSECFPPWRRQKESLHRAEPWGAQHCRGVRKWQWGAQGQMGHRGRKKLERVVRTLSHLTSLCKEKVSEGELLTQSHGW